MRVLLIGLVLTFVALSAQAEEITIRKWPDDVPCNALRKNSDGSYVLVKDILYGPVRMEAGNSFEKSGDTHFWDQKCAGKTVK